MRNELREQTQKCSKYDPLKILAPGGLGKKLFVNIGQTYYQWFH